MIGEVFFIGRLVQDPVEYTRQDGTGVTFLRVAVNYFGNEKGNFFNLAVYGNARDVAKNLKRGEIAGFQAFATESMREYPAVWKDGKNDGNPVKLSQVVFQVRRIFYGGLNLNQWVGSGRLVDDPQLRYLSDGKPVANARIAIDSFGQREETTFLNVTVWGTMGEKLAQHKTKGEPIAVVGSLLVRDLNPISSEDLQAIRGLVEDPSSAEGMDKDQLVGYIEKLYKRRREISVVASQVLWLPVPDRRKGDAQQDQGEDVPAIPSDSDDFPVPDSTPSTSELDQGEEDAGDDVDIPDPTEIGTEDPDDDLPPWNSIFGDEE